MGPDPTSDVSTAVHGPSIDLVWRVLAPGDCAQFELIEATAQAALSAEVTRPMQRMMRSILWVEPDGRGDEPDEPGTRDALAFAEQFVIDVASITPDQRAVMMTATGREAFLFVQCVYVSDVFLRARIALQRLARADAVAAATAALDNPVPMPSSELWSSLEAFMRDVALMQSLDAMTTELVRLRGAEVHQCRLCRSRLSVKAIDQAGGIALFSRTSDLEAGGFRDADRIAVRLADAIVTQPSSIDDALVDEAHRHFTDVQLLELVFDIVRNAANKIAVAFGADDPVVTEGIEFYDIDHAGEVIANIDQALVRAATV